MNILNWILNNVITIFFIICIAVGLFYLVKWYALKGKKEINAIIQGIKQPVKKEQISDGVKQ